MEEIFSVAIMGRLNGCVVSGVFKEGSAPEPPRYCALNSRGFIVGDGGKFYTFCTKTNVVVVFGYGQRDGGKILPGVTFI